MDIDPQQAIQHAKRCRALARCISDAFNDWLAGQCGLHDAASFQRVLPLLDHEREPFLMFAAFDALRREFMAIEPLIDQYGGWLRGVPFQRWLGNDGPPLTIYLAAVRSITDDETAGDYDEERLRARAAEASREMFHGGGANEFRKHAVKAGNEIASDCDDFCLAVDGVVREMERRKAHGRSRAPTRIVVSTSPPQVMLDGQPVALTEDEAHCLKSILDERDWLSSSEISRQTAIARADRIIARLRDEKLKNYDVIETRQYGSRIKPEWLA